MDRPLFPPFVLRSAVAERSIFRKLAESLELGDINLADKIFFPSSRATVRQVKCYMNPQPAMQIEEAGQKNFFIYRDVSYKSHSLLKFYCGSERALYIEAVFLLSFSLLLLLSQIEPPAARGYH